MSFRKRNVGLGLGAARDREVQSAAAATPKVVPTALPGLRPSPIDGRATTSTGTQTLDDLLAGHAGLPMGTSILVGENGTTDYAGVLLRYCAAEGLVQGHHVHVIGFPEAWGRELPGLIEGSAQKEKPAPSTDEKMKIAWRYERQSHLLAERSGRRGPETPPSQELGAERSTSQVFCHSFDLTKRLVHPADSTMSFYGPSVRSPTASPFAAILQDILGKISVSGPSTVHRIVIPSLLSPALYPPQASKPEFVLQFMHSIRALLSTYSDRITAMISFPLSLYPRSSGLTRWVELLSDGVIELSPFPHSSGTEVVSKPGQDEQPQGLLTVHCLPILHERGGGSGAVSEESEFILSRKRFTIRPFSLPPMEGDTEAQQERSKKADIDF